MNNRRFERHNLSWGNEQRRGLGDGITIDCTTDIYTGQTIGNG